MKPILVLLSLMLVFQSPANAICSTAENEVYWKKFTTYFYQQRKIADSLKDKLHKPKKTVDPYSATRVFTRPKDIPKFVAFRANHLREQIRINQKLARLYDQQIYTLQSYAKEARAYASRSKHCSSKNYDRRRRIAVELTERSGDRKVITAGFLKSALEVQGTLRDWLANDAANYKRDIANLQRKSVKPFQTFLKRMGYYDGSIDGILGPGAEKATSQFLRNDPSRTRLMKPLIDMKYSQYGLTSYVDYMNTQGINICISAVMGKGNQQHLTSCKNFVRAHKRALVRRYPQLKRLKH